MLKIKIIYKIVHISICSYLHFIEILFFQTKVYFNITLILFNGKLGYNGYLKKKIIMFMGNYNSHLFQWECQFPGNVFLKKKTNKNLDSQIKIPVELKRISLSNVLH